MKKILLTIVTLVALMIPAISKADSFTTADTIYATIDTSANVYDTLNITASSVTLKWHVTACTFPSDWLAETSFGICDNSECHYNSGGTAIWNPSTSTGATFTSAAYSTGLGDFHLVLGLKGLTCGTHTVTVALSDPSTFTAKTVTFVINKPCPSNVPGVSKSEDVVLYPNPATSELNVVYDPSADVKTISVYNIIGKVMTVYKVSGNSGANLNLENIPSGIYFVRLFNTQGAVIATKKFTKQ